MKRTSLVLAMLALAACNHGGKSVGEACTGNDECASGLCSNGTVDCHDTASTCRCQRDRDCGIGRKCQLTIDCGTVCN